MALLILSLLPLAAARSWIDNTELRQQALARKPLTVKRFELDLDLPPEHRWTHIYSDPLFTNASQDVKDYFASNIPGWTLPLLEKIAADLRGHFHEYGDEMKGIAEALHMPIGTVVLVNLVYTLEGIASNGCKSRNSTGPCPDQPKRPGLCTSLVAKASDGSMWHGRNMDWNLPANLRKYVFDVDFIRHGRRVFRTTTVAGLVGALHGFRPDGFSVSINARDHGGKVLPNLLKFLIKTKACTSTHLLRAALETAGSFDNALHMLSDTSLVEPVYYIIGGPLAGQGAVVARDRKGPHDVWLMNKTSVPSPWFLLQTNYDRWLSPPSWDDRRTPGIKHMFSLGQSSVDESGLLSVLRQWPTFNDHTDITAVMRVSSSPAHRSTDYLSLVWMDDVVSTPLLAVSNGALPTLVV